MIVRPAVVGGGKRFLPEGVRLDLELLEERQFASGVLILRYGVRGAARGLASGVKSSESCGGNSNARRNSCPSLSLVGSGIRRQSGV
jgi:hypothetical protein